MSSLLFVNYRVFLVRKYRAAGNIRDATPTGTTSDVYDIDRFFKEELQTTLISCYRVVKFESVSSLKAFTSDTRGV
jgi:hypothetical protein